jgi:hypothetical protein
MMRLGDQMSDTSRRSKPAGDSGHRGGRRLRWHENPGVREHGPAQTFRSVTRWTVRSTARSRAVAAAAVVMFAASACGGAAHAGSAGDARPGGASQGAQAITADDFDAASFGASYMVDNQWFPLKPGTRYVFEGSALDHGERIERRVVSIVTDLVKMIGGVRTAVLWERDFEDGELVEAELAFFAQDEDGNVWHLGEYPEEYDGGEFDKAPAWIAGVEGATAGVAMRAQPRLGTSDYAQGFAPPPVNWTDRGRVFRVGASTCVPVDCFDDVLVIEEFEIDKPDASQLKYYAPGVGGVKVGWRGSNEKDREVLKLVDLTTLGANQLAEARAAAFSLEKHGYNVNEAYATTSPLQPRPDLS